MTTVAVTPAAAVLWPDFAGPPSPAASTPVSSFSDPSARRQLAEMKQTLALARVSRDDVRAAYAATMQRLELARTELATIVRRGDLARQIDDHETVEVAERFAETQRNTILVLERKVAVQHDELVLTERTVSEMEAELRARTGIGPAPSAASGAGSPSSPSETPLVDAAEFRGLDDAARARTAEERLAELKRRMGRD
ncbi:MAG: hypothetical protein U5K74_05855 [Gemmatimonadaceae bacterium]|nr:hypothetical protein [Gemmatimonadaceae bacterium]